MAPLKIPSRRGRGSGRDGKLRDGPAADYGNGRIRLITPAGDVTTLASISNSYSIAVIVSSGSFVVGDSSTIRLVTTTGVVTTLAGSGNLAFADGAGPSSSFYSPEGVAVNPLSGTIVVADVDNHRIRLITLPPLALSACNATWHHVAISHSASASSISAYIDGALTQQKSATIALPAASASTLRIGWSGNLSANGGSLFAGALSELRIYSRALSSVEVLALAQPPLTYANAVSSPSVPTASATA